MMMVAIGIVEGSGHEASNGLALHEGSIVHGSVLSGKLCETALVHHHFFFEIIIYYLF